MLKNLAASVRSFLSGSKDKDTGKEIKAIDNKKPYSRLPSRDVEAFGAQLLTVLDEAGTRIYDDDFALDVTNNLEQRVNRSNQRRAIRLVKAMLNTYGTLEGYNTKASRFWASLDTLASNDRSIDLCTKIIESRTIIPVAEAIEDLVTFCKPVQNGVSRNATPPEILMKLPEQIVDVVDGIVDDIIKENCDLSNSVRRRYNNIGPIVHSLEPFRSPSHPATYKLIEKAIQMDDHYILYDLYEKIAQLPVDIPDNVIKLVDLMLSNILAELP